MKFDRKSIYQFALLIVVTPLAASCSVLGVESEQQKVFELRLNTAVAKYEEGNVVMAANMARRALEIEPKNGEALSVLGMSLARNASATSDAMTSYQLVSDAIDAFMRAEDAGTGSRFQVSFGHGTARTLRARLCYSLAETEDRRQKIASDAEAKPGAEKLTDLKGRYQKRADQLRSTAKEDLTIGEQRLLASLSQKPNYIETHEHLQAVYALDENYEKCAEWGNKILALIEEQREERKNYIARADSNVSVSQRLRSELEQLDIKETNSRSLLALAYSRLNNPRAAILELNRVLSIRPDRAEEYFNRGVCRQLLSDYNDAAGDFETFIRKSTAGPDSPMIQDAWNRIHECKQKGGLNASNATAAQK
ncbi:MAG: tetratricopeptide repeat protein [Planctomycetota bacterium]